MKLIVGLGNPGKEYVNTRHNVGFSLVDYIVNDMGLEYKGVKFNAQYLDFYIDNEKVIIIKPLSYMNLSGGVVKKYIDYYKIDLDDILVIQDDLDMNVGRVKIVYDSSSGGHNGIKDIENNLGSKKYARLKIGISKDKDMDTRDYVLGKFSTEEVKILNDDYVYLVNVIDDFCKLNLDKLMSKYNRK